jgi:hypothetical protein
MPVFRIQVNYTQGLTGKWSNVWHVNAVDMGDAIASCVIGMEDHLLQLLSTTCLLKSYLISDPATDAFFTEDRNNAGLNGDTGSLLPLYNSVKVLFPPTDFGRPDLKYFKGYVGENRQSAGVLDAGAITQVETEVEGMIDDMTANSTPLCSDDGSNYTAASVQPAVQMRQMHRKRRKTVVTP